MQIFNLAAMAALFAPAGCDRLEPSAAPAFAGGAVEYSVDGVVMEGYLAAPTHSDSRRPAVLVVHDWNGIDSHEKSVADKLAAMGYVAFCADVYGKGVRPANTEESRRESGKYYADHALLLKRANGGLAFLRQHEQANKSKVAAIGYCFGGMAVLELARSGAELKAVVSFHGSLATTHPMPKGGFKGKTLVLHGADDPFVPRKDVDGLIDEFLSAAVPLKIVEYAGVVHSFTVDVPSSVPGAKYDAEADRKSWQEMKTFLAEAFKS